MPARGCRNATCLSEWLLQRAHRSHRFLFFQFRSNISGQRSSRSAIGSSKKTKVVNVSVPVIVALTVSATVFVTVRVTASVPVNFEFAVDAMRRVFGCHADRLDIFQSKPIS